MNVRAERGEMEAGGRRLVQRMTERPLGDDGRHVTLAGGGNLLVFRSGPGVEGFGRALAARLAIEGLASEW